jgi:hypothetical protein
MEGTGVTRDLVCENVRPGLVMPFTIVPDEIR